MISQLRISRSRSDSRPRPIQVPGRSTRVRSLIDFYNQKALQKSSVVTSRPYNDRNRIPSDKVRSLVQNFSRAASAVSGSGPSSRDGVPRDGANSPVVLRHGRGSLATFKNGTTSPIALRGNIELVTVEREIGGASQPWEFHPRRTNTGLRTVKNWKSSRFQRSGEPIMTSETEEYVVRKSTRRKRTTRRAPVDSEEREEETLLPPKQIQPLTAPVLRALESEITRSSSLGVEISSPGDVVSDGESASSQTSESSSKKFREQEEAKKGTDIKVNIESVGLEAASQQALSTVSKRSSSWKGAFRTMRDTFRKRPSTAESSPSKLSDESAPAYKPKAIKSLIDNLTPDSPATTYLTAPDYMPDSLRAISRSPTSNVQARIQRLQMLETVASESENENILPNGIGGQRKLSEVDVDKVLQEVSDLPLSQPLEDPNTISGMGEMASWDSTIARQKKRARAHKTFSKQRRGDRLPVAGLFRPISPIQRRESPLKPVSPLRVFKEKTKTTPRETSETITITSPIKSKPSVLLTRASMDTLTSFKEPSLPGSAGSSIEAQNEETQVGASLDAVELMFESLSDLTTPPSSRPLQEVRSPTVMREMAFPPLRLRESAGDASIEKKDFFDTSIVVKPAPESQAAPEQNPVPKKRIFGDADWRTDQRMNGTKNADKTNRNLQESQESSPSSYDGQTTISMSLEQESDFAILPRQNYILPVPEADDSREEFGDMIEIEAPFLRYKVNPPPPVGTLSSIYPLYQINREFIPRYFSEGTSVIEVGVDGHDEMATRGRRRKRIGS
ncbi:hypothetical protein Q9L58_007799 [Maublancomyces gigas]|uniref:Uncharacterized protein n=1 Tax=Discina gigas TaxID=1032678 RepID=A0ABR3GBG4_9PEZI